MDRLQQILQSKEFRNIPPVSDCVIEKIQRKTSRFMLFSNRDRIHGTCENCLSDIEFEKNTKHGANVVCPHCGKTMKVEHVWRKKGCDYTIDWFAQGRAISKDVFVIRYYAVEQGVFCYWNKSRYESGDGYKKTVKEEAREVFDFKTGNRYKLNHCSAGWEKNSYHFYEFSMGCYGTRKQFCRQATILQTRKQALKEISKIECLKYYDVDRKLASHWVWDESLYGLLSAPLYEKMEKIGLNDMATYDFGRNEIKWNRKETSLVKMLKLDKARYKMFLNRPNTTVLSFLQRNKKLSIKDIETILSLNNGIRNYNELKSKHFPNPIKGIKYLAKNNMNLYEYTHYLNLLEKLEYDIKDESYIFPKDFRKADDRVSKEWQDKQDAEELERMSEQSKLIKGISDGLKKMNGLQEFIGGSNGLLVYVPESAKDLIEEGRALHNCIGTYVDRIARNKTLVFFVRRLNAPNDPFVAFEYYNGDVVQCRYDNNEAVKNDEKGAEILSFVDAFAERLRQNKVLCAA